MAGHLAPCGAYFSDRGAGTCSACYGRVPECPCVGCVRGQHRLFDSAQKRAAKNAGRRTNGDLFVRRHRQAVA